MSKHPHHKKHQQKTTAAPAKLGKKKWLYLSIGMIMIIASFLVWKSINQTVSTPTKANTVTPKQIDPSALLDSVDKWISRTKAVSDKFHAVYTPCWEGAYGAIGDAYLFATTHDSSLLQFHTIEHDLRKMCVGTWVDDRAWICLAEFYWWDFTGRKNQSLIDDAKYRYDEARNEGRLSNHNGYWSWYNWPLKSGVSERIFTNSNMNQMVTVACWLYQITGEKKYLNDALLAWNGDKKFPGIEKMLYKGNGVWQGKQGRAAFGNEVPWQGAGYCTIGAELYKVTKDKRYKQIVIETAKRIMDPKNGWIDPTDYFQIQMDGNGAFVNFLFDAYTIAPDELKDIPFKVEKMLEHVWTNHHGTASVTLHRETDHGIRNGWNPYGGEDGYGVDEVGTVHAQGEAVRAFGTFVYYYNSLHEKR